MCALVQPISQLPAGFVASNVALTAIDVSTLGENAVVQTLGRATPNDGGAGLFYFSAGSSATVDKINVLATSSTGRWIAARLGFSGVGPITTNFTGIAETFVLLSGRATAVTYTLPPTTNMVGKRVTVKSATTGTVNIRCANAVELIVDNGVSDAAAVAAISTSTLTGGMVWNFIPYGNRWYRIDQPWGLV